jgi:tetraacyldisaccharide 4'-kinase
MLRRTAEALAEAGQVDRIRRVVSERTRIFHLERALGGPVLLEPERSAAAGLKAGGSTRVVAFAGIAGPDRFGEALRQSGWEVAELVAFPDHHRYERRDLHRIAAAVTSTRAEGALTTEKDAMRLLRLRPFPVPIASIPLEVVVVPAPEFGDWLVARVRQVRA